MDRVVWGVMGWGKGWKVGEEGLDGSEWWYLFTASLECCGMEDSQRTVVLIYPKAQG